MNVIDWNAPLVQQLYQLAVILALMILVVGAIELGVRMQRRVAVARHRARVESDDVGDDG